MRFSLELHFEVVEESRMMSLFGLPTSGKGSFPIFYTLFVAVA